LARYCSTIKEFAMNTANLQLEGLYAVIAELLATLQAKAILSVDETDALLRRAEQSTGADAERRGTLSLSEFEAVLFPIRLLMEANRASERDERLGFSELAKLVGQSKPARPGVRSSAESLALAIETERESDA
jgi:hypothetical protein